MTVAKKLVVRFFTHDTCSLCVPVKFIIKKVQNKIPFEYTECDIHAPENKKWFDLYRYEIPVVHIDGEEAFRNRLSEPDFLKALQVRAAKDTPAS